MTSYSVTIAGVTFPDVPAVDLTKSGGGTARYTNVADTTAIASDVASGKTFYTAAGVKTAGTAASAGGVVITDTTDTHGGTIRTITGTLISGTKSITSNGTGIDVASYAAVDVAVPSSGSSKNTQIVQGTTRTNASSLTAIGSELTVSKTGTYDIYYSCMRTFASSSYTWGTRLYIDGTAYGTENTTWTDYVQNTHLTGISLTADQKLRVYGRETRGTSYYVYAPMLAIVEA